MCGFAGFLETSGARYPSGMEGVAREMNDTLRHRGPDDSGTWCDEAAGFVVGHRRLSIVELSALGHQPMQSACGRFVVAYNGEVYNFREIRGALEKAGYSFRGGSDTEVLLAAISAWGLEEALRRFVGMFAFALWDRQERTLSLCRDRFGEKPLYYGWSGSTFLFGSELKALRAHPAWRGEYDTGAVSLFLRFCYVPAPYSIYRGIRKLPPGTYLTLHGADPATPLEPRPYWSAREVVERGMGEPFRGTPAEAAEELDVLLRASVRQQMVADVPLGAFLSGGIDSSAIVALMQAQSTRAVKTFSIGFHESSFNEAVHAAAVARHLGTEHCDLYVSAAEAMEVIPRLPALYDEPFADSSQIPTFLVSRLARGSVTVSLSGDGGDELFGGYVRHQLGPRIWNGIRRLPTGVRRSAGEALAAIPGGVWAALDGGARHLGPRMRQRNSGEKVLKLAAVLKAGNPDAIYRSLVAAWSDPRQAVRGVEPPATLIDLPSEWPALTDFASRMMYLDAMTYLPDDILVKVDRAAMGVSLETRVPFLDHRVFEFVWRLPPEYKIRGGVSKWLLRQVLYRYVPPALVERPKAGFAVPVGEWMRGPLREWAEGLLDPRGLEEGGVFDPGPIRRYWREHLAGTADRTLKLWPILIFQAWERETKEADLPRVRIA